MKVVCPFCFSKARIVSRNNMNEKETIADLYCQCTNVQTCGATVVYSLSYKHVINPPARTYAQIALDLVNRLSKDERAALQRDLFVN